MHTHPLNRGFVWSVPAGPYRAITSAQAERFDCSGGFCMPDVFPAADVRRIVQALDPIADRAQRFLRAQRNGTIGIARADDIVFSPHVVQQSTVARAASTHPVILDLCRDLIGPDVRLYWDQLVYKMPGTVDEFPWHQDNGYNYVEPQQYLTCWIALTDATLANGCPWIAPGVHTRGTLLHEWTPLGYRCLDDVHDAEPLVLSAGSVAVFSSLTPHRTGSNSTSDVRKALILQYAPHGAVMFPRQGPSVTCDDPARQFRVLAGGRPL